MHRISLIISEIYHKFLPIAERSGIAINLSCPDPSIQVEHPEQLVADLERSLNDTLSRTSASEIQISVDRHAITITDPETVLSHTACALLSRNFLTVDSRVGFGTTISIALQRPTETAESAAKPQAPEISAMSLEIAETPEDPTPAPKPAKSDPKSSKKPLTKQKSVKTDRKLARAAKQADRKVQKLAKKAKKAKNSRTQKSR